MNTVRDIDNKLMQLLTYSFFYPDPEERPQTRLAMLATLVPANLLFLAVSLQSGIGVILTGPLWLIAIYEWRLWVRLQKQKRS
jgi:hypothetical protein